MRQGCVSPGLDRGRRAQRLSCRRCLLPREVPTCASEPGSIHSTSRGGRGCPQCAGEAAGSELARWLLWSPALAWWLCPHSVPFLQGSALVASSVRVPTLPVSVEPSGEASRGRDGGVERDLDGEEV